MSPRGRRGGGARSEDDRQQARLEREQRRAQREGRPVPRSLEDLPAAEPGIDPSAVAPPSSDARPGAGPVQDGPGTSGPAGRRERLAALRAGTDGPGPTAPADAPAADRPVGPPATDRPQAATPQDWPVGPSVAQPASAADRPSAAADRLPDLDRASGAEDRRPAADRLPGLDRPSGADDRRPAADRHPAADRASGADDRRPADDRLPGLDRPSAAASPADARRPATDAARPAADHPSAPDAAADPARGASSTSRGARDVAGPAGAATSAGRPWWSTDGPQGPPPPAAPSRPASPAGSEHPTDATRPAADAPPGTAPRGGQDRRRVAGGTPAADARPAPGGRPGPDGPAAPGARPAPDARPARPDRSPDDLRRTMRAPGVPGAAAGAAAAAPGAGPPRGRGPAPSDHREVEDWFGPDETGETGARDPRSGTATDDDRPAEREGLVPLRPAGPLRPSGAAPATVHTRTAPSRRGVSRIAAVVVLLPLVVVVAVAVFLFQPFTGDGEGEVRVRIQPGSSVDEIGKLLQERGVVSNSLAFAIRARISGDGANLKAGTLRLRKGMSYGAALTALQQDPLPPSVVRVGIPEGLSRSEIASSVRRAGVTGSYLSASARSAGFDPQDFGQPRARKGLEGFLFPATYELQRGGATAKNLVAEQVKAFRTNFEKVSTTRARRAGLSRYDVLIIASMIEREVRIPSERRLVSAVIWNRLEQDIALGIDATTRYAVKNWTRPLLQSEIDRDTPYDTRRKKGLPPTPIGSPGLAAMRAAANPARSSFLYYVVRPCGDGRHNFATTNAEFEKDRAAYNAAQRRAGGDPSPSDAKGC